MTLSLTPITLAQGQLPSSEAAIYTCPANSKVIITQATFTNEDTGALTMTIYKVNSGGTALAANTIINALPLPTLYCYVSPELPNKVLAAGDSIHGLAGTAAKITYDIAGYLVV